MKKILVAVLALMLLTVGASAAFFEKTVSFADGTFSDVAANAWYAKDVQSSYEFGLVNGVGGGKFDPNGTVTVAQAVTLAARFNAAYNNKTIGTGGEKWYSANVDYAVKNGIMTATQFDNYDRAAKRHEVATLFASSLPGEYFKPFNTVFSIPDVPADKPYHKALMTLYKAGVAMGSDAKGTFNPDSNITRAEFSALINRVAAPGNRLAKTFDKMPREDSYFLIDSLGMGYDFDNQKFINLPSGWVVDNKNMENSTNGQVGRVVGDQTGDDYVTMFKDIDEVKSGRLFLEFYGKMNSKDDGLYIGFADDKNNVKAGITTDYGVFSIIGKDKVKTAVKVSADNPEEYIILLTVDFDNDEIYAYVNGERTPSVKLADGLSVERFILGSTKQGTGYMAPTHVRLYQNYAYVDRFMIPETNAGKEPDSMNVYGNFALEEFINEYQEDKYSVKIDAKAGSENIASRGFAAISEKGVFETYVLLPEGTNGAFFTITSANADVVKIYSKDGAWFVGDKKMRDFTANVWQTLRIETDAAAKKAVIKICGKTVGEVAISAQYIDGIKIGFNPDKDGVMWFDDITAFNYIDHADYPAVPKANNNDGYNIGINVCNLWRDNTTQEGWQDVSPFADLEPWLGFYDEGSPELADWEIKIMAEHGIDFQHFCWYQPEWPAKKPIKLGRNAHWAIHDGYMNAKYSDMVKFCIMWENANSPKTTLEDFKEYIWNYWKEYYFSDPRYMTLDNKPILTVWTYGDFKNTFGGVEGAKQALDFMREDIKTLGYDGLIFLVKSSKNPSEIGADAGYFYHYSQDGYSADHQIKTLEGYKGTELHAIPTLAMGHNGIGRYDYRVPIATMEDHKRAAEYIKNDYLASMKTGTWKDNTLFVSTWNEYSEGHYICPSGEFGYGYLENIKDVFTNDKSDHTALDVKPTDAQKARITKMYDESFQPLRLYRYEDPDTNVELKPLVTWDFSNDESIKGWTFTSLAKDGKTENGMKFHGENDDPQMYLYDANIDLSKKPVIHVRMKTVELAENRNPSIYVFFTTIDSPAMEGSVKFKRIALQKDGKTHDYYIDMSAINDWTGTLKNLRVDPISAVDPFEIELVELLVPANEEAKVYANGLQMTFDFPTAVKDGDVEVTANPTLGFFTMLNLHYTWDRYTGSFHVESKNHTLDMKTGSSKAIYDGKEIDLGYTFNIRDGLPVIRLMKLCDLLGFKYEFKDNALSITSTSRKPVTPEKEEYYGWDFEIDGNNEGWHTSDSIVSVGNGRLFLDNPTHFDIHLFSPVVSINSNKYTKLKVGVYADPADAKGQSFQMYFRASGQSLDEKKSVKHKYDISKMKKGELYEFEIDLAANENWYGIIYDLRVDMFNAQKESAIEYIHFIPKTGAGSEDAEEEKETMTEVKRFDFNDEAEVKTFQGTGVTPKFDNGCIVLTDVKSNDPQLYLYNAGINASEADTIKIGIRTNKEAMAGKYFQVFFTTDSDKTFDQKKSATGKYDVSAKNDGDLYEVVINMGAKAGWTGTIANLRFDPFDSQAEAVIDYIVIGKKAAVENKVVAVSNMVDPATAPYVYNFDKEGEVKFWGNNGNVGIESGMLSLTGTKSLDVQLYFEELGIDASKVDSVTVGIKVNKAAMLDNFMQLFFTTDSDKTLDAKKSVTAKYSLAGVKDGDILPVTISLASKDSWKGTVNKIRLDAFEHQSDVYIDFIAFGKVSSQANAGAQQSGTTSSGTSGAVKWDFDSEPEKVEGNGVIVYIQDGMLVMDEPNNKDIQVYFNGLNLDASKYSKFRMGIKVNKEAMNEKMWMNLFFVTDKEKSFDAKKSFTHTYKTADKADGDIYEIVIDLKSKETWKDTITRLRIDPYDVQTQACIDYIYIE